MRRRTVPCCHTKAGAAGTHTSLRFLPEIEMVFRLYTNSADAPVFCKAALKARKRCKQPVATTCVVNNGSALRLVSLPVFVVKLDF